MNKPKLKFGYSEKATKFKKYIPLKFDAMYSLTSNFKWKIFPNFVAFSEYPNFNITRHELNFTKKKPNGKPRSN